MPSDIWCNTNKFGEVRTGDDGKEFFDPDYSKALMSNAEIRLLITKMGAIMAERDFPLKSLEDELKQSRTAETENMLLAGKYSGEGIVESSTELLQRVAQIDICLDLDFEVKKHGPRNQVTFNVRAIDPYTRKQIAGVTSVGEPSANAPVDLLLEASVVDYMDNFVAQIQRHFDDMFTNGREVRVELKKLASWQDDFDMEVQYNGMDAQLNEVIEVWFEENAVNGRFSVASSTPNLMRFDQVRTPLYAVNRLTGRERAIDTRNWVDDLSKILKNNYNIPNQIYTKGLGEVWLLLGE